MIGLPEIITVAGLAGLVWLLVLRRRQARIPKYCLQCGSVSSPRNRMKGSFAIEIILWLCFLLPGIIYTVWRFTTQERVCSVCGANAIIPTDSPKAKAALGAQ